MLMALVHISSNYPQDNDLGLNVITLLLRGAFTSNSSPRTEIMDYETRDQDHLYHHITQGLNSRNNPIVQYCML